MFTSGLPDGQVVVLHNCSTTGLSFDLSTEPLFLSCNVLKISDLHLVFSAAFKRG